MAEESKAPNGVIFSEKSGIERLIDKLKSFFDDGDSQENGENPSQKKTTGEGGSIPKKPKPDDFNRMIGNLGLTVPTGFVLLHNDLLDITDILNKKGSSGGGGGGAVSTASNVITAISTTASAVTDIISAIKSPAGLGDILDNEEINDLLAHDPDVYTIRLAGTKGYLKAYYQDMINTLGFEWDMSTGELTESTGKGSGVHDFASGLASFAGSLVQSVGSAIMNLMEESKLNSIPEILQIRKEGYVAYLKAYYSSMLTEFNLTYDWDSHTAVEKQTGWSLFGQIGRGLGDFFGGIVGGTASAIGNSINNGVLDTDPEVHAIRKEGYIAYLKAYYSNMLTEFNLTYDWNSHQSVSKESNWSLFGKIGKGIGDLFGGIVGGTANALGTAINNAVLDTDPEVHALRKEGYMAYLKGYWISTLETLGFSLQEDGTLVSLVDGREQRKGLFQNVKELFTGDATTQINNKIKSSLINNLDTIFKDVTVQTSWEFVGKYMGGFLSSYFESLQDNIENDASSWDMDKNTKKAFGKAILGAISDNFNADSLKTSVEVNSIDYTSTLRDIKMTLNSVKSFMTDIYNSIGSDIQTDIKTIADNSGKVPPVESVSGTNFDYAGAEPR